LRKIVLFVLLLSILTVGSTCRRRNSDIVTVALPEKFTAFDTLTSTANDASAERVKSLIFNSLVKKDANFDLGQQVRRMASPMARATHR